MKNQFISVLFTQPNSIYLELVKDCWDKTRDARKWPGGNSLIAHPPCRAWGKLRHMANPEPGERELAIIALGYVRKWGGILEHPRASKLWPEYINLSSHPDQYGGFTISINQSWYGHPATKATLLYICGCDPRDLPPMPLSFDRVDFTIGGRNRRNKMRSGKKEVSRIWREKTPIDLAKWLIEVAMICQLKKPGL